MASEFETRWQKVRKPLIVVAIIALVVGVLTLIAVIILGYWFQWPWVGLSNGYSTITETNTIHGTAIAKEQPVPKTLWDWLQLLIVPLVLAIGVFWLNQIQKSRDERATAQRDKTEREIAADNQQEAALQAYLDKMSELLLEKKLRDSAEDDEIRKVARVRTLTVLRGLDSIRKASVIQFLYESGLIDKDKRIIDISGANLSGADLIVANFSKADLSKAYLTGAYLTGANLSKANLSGVNLGGANLSFAGISGAYLTGAYLSKAYLTGAYLSGANLRDARGITEEELEEQAKSLQGATMPDGLKHP